MIEGARNALGEVDDPAPPFAPYRANDNAAPNGRRQPFAGFEARWYSGP